MPMLQNIMPCQVFVLEGAAGIAKKAAARRFQAYASKFSHVIALLDPDVAGRQARTVLDACLPGRCHHAFIPASQATALQNIR